MLWGDTVTSPIRRKAWNIRENMAETREVSYGDVDMLWEMEMSLWRIGRVMGSLLSDEGLDLARPWRSLRMRKLEVGS